MKRNYLLLLLVALLTACSGSNKNVIKIDENGKVILPEGKAIYIPQEFKDIDFQDPESQWSYHRMYCTDNLVIFWEKGFGPDLATAPDLEGQDMKVDLKNLADRVEHFYDYFTHTLQFTKHGSNAEKYRMMVMVRYSLEGTAYGGDYDNTIGALWVTPQRIQDQKLNCLAHELGHSFQSHISIDKQGEAWGGHGIFEMCSQYMLWHVNPYWPTDEQYHWEAFSKEPHKAFLHLANIYRSPYVLEYWSQKHGPTFIGELFRQGKRGEDPAQTYMRMNNLTQEQFCDEMYDASTRIINLDFDRAYNETRAQACLFNTPMQQAADGSLYPDTLNCPENYGFNAIRLDVPQAGQTVTVSFKGEAGKAGYTAIHTDKAGWRYGFVAIGEDGNATYGEMQKTPEGTVSYTADAPLRHLYFVVMGAPSEHWQNPHEGKDAQWPYSIRIK